MINALSLFKRSSGIWSSKTWPVEISSNLSNAIFSLNSSCQTFSFIYCLTTVTNLLCTISIYAVKLHNNVEYFRNVHDCLLGKSYMRHYWFQIPILASPQFLQVPVKNLTSILVPVCEANLFIWTTFRSESQFWTIFSNFRIITNSINFSSNSKTTLGRESSLFLWILRR